MRIRLRHFCLSLSLVSSSWFKKVLLLVREKILKREREEREDTRRRTRALRVHIDKNSRIYQKILEQDILELRELTNRNQRGGKVRGKQSIFESLLNNEGEGVSEEDLEIYRSAIKENKKLVPEYQSRF